MHPFYLRINRSRTDAAGYEEVFLLFQLFYILMDKLGRISKRSYEIMECIPSLEGAHLLGRSSHGLEYDRDRSCLTVKITYGQRDSLALFAHLDDDKFARLTCTRYTRCFYNHQINLICQFFSF